MNTDRTARTGDEAGRSHHHAWRRVRGHAWATARLPLVIGVRSKRRRGERVFAELLIGYIESDDPEWSSGWFLASEPDEVINNTVRLGNWPKHWPVAAVAKKAEPWAIAKGLIVGPADKSALGTQ